MLNTSFTQKFNNLKNVLTIECPFVIRKFERLLSNDKILNFEFVYNFEENSENFYKILNNLFLSLVDGDMKIFIKEEVDLQDMKCIDNHINSLDISPMETELLYERLNLLDIMQNEQDIQDLYYNEY